MKLSRLSVFVFSLGGFLSALQFLLCFFEAELAHGQSFVALFCLLSVLLVLISYVLLLLKKKVLLLFLSLQGIAILLFANYGIAGSVSRYNMNIDGIQLQIIKLWIAWGMAIAAFIYGIAIYLRSRKT